MRLPLAVASVFALVGATHVAASSLGGRRTNSLLACVLFPLFNWFLRDLDLTLFSSAFPGQVALPTLADVSAHNVTNGTFLSLENIQGDILYATISYVVMFESVVNGLSGLE